MLAASCLLVSAGLTPSLSATPLPDPLKSIDFTVHGGVAGSYNSNVLSSAGNVGGVQTKFDDYIFTFNPGIKLQYGDIPDTTLSIDYTETFLRYYEHPSLNEDLSNVAFSVTRKQGTFDLSAAASYVQNYTNTPSGGGGTSILRSDVIDLSGNANWNYSAKFNFQTGIDYNQVHYLYAAGAGSQDTDTYTVPFSGYYVYSDQVSFGLGYTYSQTNLKAAGGGTAGPARYNNTFSFNTKLTKWNNLTGSANVGVTSNHVDGTAGGSATDTGTISYGLNLQYAYSEKVNFTLSGSRNFSTGTAGQNVQATTIGLGLGYNYSDNISLQANLITYTYSQYIGQNRHDDTKTSGITLNWKPYSYLTLSAGYSYFMNSSDAANSTYNINIVSVSGTVSY